MDRSTGGVGGITPVNPSEARMIERAIRHGWPMSETIKRMTVNKLAAIVDHSKSERSVIAASKALVAIGKLNADLDKPTPESSVTVGVQVNQGAIVSQEQLADLSTEELRQYLAVKRKLIGRSGDPSARGGAGAS